MLRAEDCALVLLAAGRSTRFGADDKLAADFDGRPLAFHAAATLAALPFAARFAVCSGTALDFTAYGYAVLHNARPEDGMSGSVALGVAAARELDCAGVVIALADMPCVTAALVRRLLDAAEGADAVAAASDGVRIGPPAVFGRGRFAALTALAGDAGARSLVRGGRHVIASEAELRDIDCPGDLARLLAERAPGG